MSTSDARAAVRYSAVMLDFKLSEEQEQLIASARRFAKERIIPVAAEADRKSEFPAGVFEAAWENGLVNPTVPAEYGGLGVGELENTMLTEELAYGCSGIQTSITANTPPVSRTAWRTMPS